MGRSSPRATLAAGRLAGAAGILLALGLASWLLTAHLDPPRRQRAWGLRAREGDRLALPAARHATTWPRQEGAPRRLVANVLPDGTLVVRGMFYEIDGPDAEVAARLADAFRSETRGERHSLLLYADRRARWEDVARTIAAARRGGDGIELLGWEILAPPWSRKSPCVLVELEEAPPPGPGFARARLAPADEARDALELRLGEARWVVRRAEASPTAGELPAGWREVATVIEGRPPGPEVVLDVAPGEVVTWGDVVHAIDVLLGAGVRAMVLPEPGWRLAFRPPEPSVWEREQGDPAAPAWVLLGCAGAAALALLVSRRPRR